MQPLRRFDQKMTQLIQDLPAAARPLMSGVSFFGEPLVVFTFGFSGFITAVQRGQSNIELAFVYAAIAYGLNTLLKLALHRRRPHNLEIRTLGLRSYSFPSGHAFGSVIFYGLFAYLDLTHLGRPGNLIIALLLWGLIFLIGLSRIHLKAHYPSDVAGGWLLGLISLLIVVRLAF
jgi:membrane-associated phospholipid phosphatase